MTVIVKDAIMRGMPESLTKAQRAELRDEDYALPESRSYPVDTVSRARESLARALLYGEPEEAVAVKRAVQGRYPGYRLSAHPRGADILLAWTEENRRWIRVYRRRDS